MNTKPTDRAGDATVYELHALRYATNSRRTAHQNFMVAHDIHDAAMPMDFYVWVAVSADRVILIDAGCDKTMCDQRGHEFLISPDEALQRIGIQPGDVTDIVVTHMHWDHAGNLPAFPNARIIVHEREMAYATGRDMCHPVLRRPYDAEQVCDLIRALYGDRLEFNQSDMEVAPGLSVHLVGGHTPGLQIVRVQTQRGAVVLASDAMHFYANGTLGNPFPVLVNMADYLHAYPRIAGLAESPDHIIAGHDPLVMQAFPASSPELEGLAVRLDVPPLTRLPRILS